MEGTHAALRRQIETLETRVGAQLLRHGANGLKLIAADRQLLPQAFEPEAALMKISYCARPGP